GALARTPAAEINPPKVRLQGFARKSAAGIRFVGRRCYRQPRGPSALPVVANQVRADRHLTVGFEQPGAKLVRLAYRLRPPLALVLARQPLLQELLKAI